MSEIGQLSQEKKLGKKRISDWLFGEYKNRATLSLFGIDIKITPDNEVKIIEINGANLGMKGFAKAYGHGNSQRRADLSLIRFLGEFKETLGLPLLVYPCAHTTTEQYLFNEFGFTLFDLECSMDYSGFYCYGPVKIAGKNVDFDSLRLGMEFQLEEPRGSRKLLFLKDFKNAKSIVWNRVPRYRRFNESRNLVINSDPIALAIDDKIKFAKLIDEKLQGSFPKSVDISPKNSCLDEILGWNCSAYIVKPANGSRGDDVYYFPKETLAYNNKFHLRPLQRLKEKRMYSRYLELTSEYALSDAQREDGFFIQEFIRSKPIFSSMTNEYHDGCMRFVAAVKSLKGSIEVIPFGGYWRLAPLPNCWVSMHSTCCWVQRRLNLLVPRKAQLWARLRDWRLRQRTRWRLIGRGVGIHWPALDEDLSVRGLLMPQRSRAGGRAQAGRRA